jgi:predicted dienelactone hydrolase
MLLLSLAVALLVSAAVAQDPCLTGAFELGDERALVALGEAIQQQCMCRQTKRPRRSERVLYQNCSRNVVRQTVLAGELRRQCLSTGYERAFRTTCATDKKTCGHYDPTRPEPVRCRIASPAQCENRGTAIETVCAGETDCSDVVDWTAATCTDPRQRGPYEAGARLMTVTKKSAVDPDQDRVLELVVWYPAVPGAAPIDPSFNAVPDAPLEHDGAPYPILMFSHGSCGYPRQSLFLTALLATYGFVVVAPPHPGNTINEFPTCGTPGAQINSAVERTPDIRFSLDTMLAENEDPKSVFFGALDPERIGMSGHSFGGLTTYLVAGVDSRFRVAVPMAPAILNFQRPLRVPSLTMIGQIDGSVNNTAVRGAFDVAAAPKLLVEIGDAGHYAFSDGCFVSADCDPPRTRTQPEAHDLVLRWVLPFLKVYLEGDPSFEPFLSAPPPPGTTDFASVRGAKSAQRRKIR